MSVQFDGGGAPFQTPSDRPPFLGEYVVVAVLYDLLARGDKLDHNGPRRDETGDIGRVDDDVDGRRSSGTVCCIDCCPSPPSPPAGKFRLVLVALGRRREREGERGPLIPSALSSPLTLFSLRPSVPRPPGRRREGKRSARGAPSGGLARGGARFSARVPPLVIRPRVSEWGNSSL